MTRKEAIERLDLCQNVCNDCLTCASHDEALDMAIAALREQESAENAHCNCCKKGNRWIGVAERLPKRGETVLCYMNFERDGFGLTWKNTITENRYDGVLVGSNPKKHVWEWQGDYVTHWMHLPEPPKEEV